MGKGLQHQKRLQEEQRKKIIEMGYDPQKILGGSKMNIKNKPRGFFANVNEVLAQAYELAYLYAEALKNRETNPNAVNELLQSEEYKNKKTTLGDNLADLNASGFNTVRRTWIERYFNNELPKGIGTHLDKEARRRYEVGEKVQGRALTPMAQAFKEAFNSIPTPVRREYEIYASISHATFLKMEDALRASGKFQEAMKLAGVVASIAKAWTQPLLKQEVTEQKTETTITNINETVIE